jgi:aarF domain-containing kinase
MSGFNFATAFAFSRTASTATSWTCRRCLTQLQGTGARTKQIRGFAERKNANGNGNGNGYSKTPRRKGRVVLAAAGGALGVTALAFTDDVKHAYGAIERSGRVASTLAVCINE